MNTFFTSDWHIGHDNVIKYSNRPFKDVGHMSEVLVNNYNASVKSDDICYFLGDMGLCKGDTLRSVIDSLNGTKVLILGNHDKNPTAMRRLGFDVVMYSARLVIARENVTLSHCPLRGIYREDVTGMRGYDPNNPKENWHGEAKHSSMFSVADEGQYHLHGHIHSPNNGKSVRILDRQFDVGVDANKYRVVSQGEIESWIAQHRTKNSVDIASK
jgi:calcineurin-like phosphoesterase family protein